jgi:hypothetical protein
MENETKDRILKGVKFFRLVKNKGNSELVQKYFMDFVDLVDRYFNPDAPATIREAEKIFNQK